MEIAAAVVVTLPLWFIQWELRDISKALKQIADELEKDDE